jgi:hypothetical protein
MHPDSTGNPVSQLPTLEPVDVLGYRAVRWSTPDLEVVISPELGGRLMAFGPPGRNLLWQNEELHGSRPRLEASGKDAARAERLRNGFLLFGGEKVWLAPQDDWEGPPYADLDHGPYEWTSWREGDAAVMRLDSRICRETDLRLTRQIRLPAQGMSLRFDITLENFGDAPVSKGIWQVTMLRVPAEVALEGAALKHFKSPEAQDALASLGSGWIVRCRPFELFKVGGFRSSGTVTARIEPPGENPVRLEKRFVPSAGDFGHGCEVEVYNSGRYPYCELEVHGPLITLPPGERTSLGITWECVQGA